MTNNQKEQSNQSLVKTLVNVVEQIAYESEIWDYSLVAWLEKEKQYLMNLIEERMQE